MRTLLRTGLVVLMAAFAGADSFTLLAGGIDGAHAAEMMNRYFMRQAEEAFAARTARYEALETEDDIRAYQSDMRMFFETQLGGFPERTPLNARTIESGARNGFRYEKVIFESRPGLFVTGLLFLPKTPGPYPGVIVPCGHSANGKAADPYQRICMLLAENGMAAFIYDPVSQGERYTYLKDDGTPEFGATLEHTLLGVGAILTGTNLAMYRIWDGMRAIDYLIERDDIDPERIGCTGNSGGGTLTSYLMALDERIQCAAPNCYLTTFERLLNTIGPQDAEQNIFGQVAYGLDHADYLHLRAPKPTLIGAATQDFFDISGTWTTYREAKRLFSRLGYSERVSIIEDDAQHGFTQPLREATARWMSRWLLEKDHVIVEPDFEVFTDEEALVTPNGQVMLLEGAISVLDLNAQRESILREQRRAFRETTDDEAFLAQVRRLTGVKDADAAPPDADKVGEIRNDGYRLEQWLLYPEPGIVLPAVWAVPDVWSGDLVIVVHPQGKAAVFEEIGAGPALLAEGHAVFAPDLRGWGETNTRDNPKGWQRQIGADWQNYFFGYLLGRSHVGMRTADIRDAARHVHAKLDRTPRRIRLTASGHATPPALHAAALYQDLFDHVLLEDGIPSWSEVVKTPRARQQLINAVHDALSWYDLPDLAALLPDDMLEIRDAHVPLF